MCFHRSFARILRSTRAGVGKSLQRGNLCQTLRQQEKVPGKDITISAHRQIETDEIMCQLFGEFGYCVDDESFDTIHLDIAHEVWFYSMCGSSEKAIHIC